MYTPSKDVSEQVVRKRMSRDQKNASFAYSLGLLRLLLKMKFLTEEEYRKIVRISAAYYEAEKIYV